MTCALGMCGVGSHPSKKVVQASEASPQTRVKESGLEPLWQQCLCLLAGQDLSVLGLRCSMWWPPHSLLDGTTDGEARQ